MAIVEIQMTVQMRVDDFMRMAGVAVNADGTYRLGPGMPDLHQMAREAVLFRLSNGGDDRRTSIPVFRFGVRCDERFPSNGWGSF